MKRKEEEEEEEEGKRQVANGDKDRERERHLCEKMFLQLYGGLGGVAHQQNFRLFNFSIVVV